jgi:hypothetical protein
MVRQAERAIEQLSKLTALLFLDFQICARAGKNATIEPGVTNLANGQRKADQIEN